MGSAGSGGSERYEYTAAPAQCALPPDLKTIGCPTVIHDLFPAGGTDGDQALTYDPSGRLERIALTTPRSGDRIIETTTVENDGEGRPTRVSRRVLDRTATSTYAWERNRVVESREGGRITYRLDRRGRIQAHETEVQTSELDRRGQLLIRWQRAETGRWVWEDERLARIEVRDSDGNEMTYRFDYSCE